MIALTIERTNRELKHLRATLHEALTLPVSPGDVITNERGTVLAKGVLHLGVPSWVLNFDDPCDAPIGDD